MIRELLSEKHQRRKFRCESEALTVYLRAHVLKNDRENLSRTHVVVESPGDTRIMGYMTLANGAVSPEIIPESGPPPYSRGTLILARLARDLEFRAAGVGPFLMAEALSVALRHAADSGIFAVEIIAKDEKARAFYQRYGFQPLIDDQLHLYLPLAAIPDAFRL